VLLRSNRRQHSPGCYCDAEDSGRENEQQGGTSGGSE